MKGNQVTLGERAERLCAQLGISENDIRRVRSKSVSIHEGREYLIVIGELPDGRSVRMSCRYDRPNHVVTFRPLPS